MHFTHVGNTCNLFFLLLLKLLLPSSRKEQAWPTFRGLKSPEQSPWQLQHRFTCNNEAFFFSPFPLYNCNHCIKDIWRNVLPILLLLISGSVMNFYWKKSLTLDIIPKKKNQIFAEIMWLKIVFLFVLQTSHVNCVLHLLTVGLRINWVKESKFSRFSKYCKLHENRLFGLNCS